MAAITERGHFLKSGLLAALGLGLVGCQTRYIITVDAIDNAQKTVGSSYHLEVQDPAGGVDKELGAHAVSHAMSALAARGMFEAPATTRPDMVINLEYGVGPGEIKIAYESGVMTNVGLGGATPMQRSTAKPLLVFEKYLVLTAREPSAAPAGAKSRGEELWSVRVSLEDENKELAPYLPVLAGGSIDFIGRNSGAEVHVSVDANGQAQSSRKDPSSR